MELRKFYAASMQEGLALVRETLGENVVILDTRTIREAGAPGGPPVERVEIWAHAPDGTEPPPAPPAVDAALPAEASATPPDALDALSRQMTGLEAQLLTVHTRLASLHEEMNWLGGDAPGVTGELASCLLDGLLQRLPLSGGIQPRAEQHRVALVGPTGVGKTSTVAKLAWDFAVRRRQPVGIMTLDTMRVGALEQIRCYCTHLDVPLEVVYDPAEMPDALARLAHCALVLIDTPGGSQRNDDHLAEVRALLLAADPDEIHLVLSATAGIAVLRDIIRRFAVLHPDQVIFTKVDEAPSCLEAFALLLGSSLSLSYIGNGQSITADLAIADPRWITQNFARQ